jgi:large subunit ribosomal protein L23
MAIFGKSTTQKNESKKPAIKAAAKSPAKAGKVTKAPRAKKMEMTPAVTAPALVKTPAVAVDAGAVVAHPVILAPHITEKANVQNEKHNVYTFKVALHATKHNIAHAIKNDYKVTPVDVRLVSMPGKTIVYRGRYAFKAGYRKAYVSLKKGDKIDFAA